MHKIILVAIALTLLVGPAQAVLQPDPSRFDLENQVPGAVIERSLTIRNQAGTATKFDLEVVRFQDEDVTITPSQLQLGPGESGRILVTIRLADDAAGGRHDLRITATDGASQATDGVGARSAVRMPIIFHVENLKVASLRIDDALSGSQGNATAMVFNHLLHETNATLHILVRDEAGREVFRAHSDANAILPEAHRFFTVPIDGLPGGAYTVEAWAEHAGGRSNAMQAGYAVGAKSMTVSPARVEPLGDGLYRLSADFGNTGTIGFDLETKFRIDGPEGVREIAAPTYTLAATQSIAGSISVRLEPGLHEIVAVATWDGGHASSPAITYVASHDDRPTDPASSQPMWPFIMGGAGLAAGVGVAVVGRRRRS